tara:strand:- start:68 stop:346 length:279 start_codon:yes stop_codon:yes gene_type:complete
VGFVIRDETAAAASIFAAAAEGEAYDDDSVAASPLAAAMNCEGGSHVVSRVPDAECVEGKRDVSQNPTQEGRKGQQARERERRRRVRDVPWW